MSTDWTPRPYGSVALRAPVAATSTSIPTRVIGASTFPPYSAFAQCTRSSGVEATEPAAPAAVTTEVKGIIGVPSERSMGLAARPACANR